MFAEARRQIDNNLATPLGSISPAQIEQAEGVLLTLSRALLAPRPDTEEVSPAMEIKHMHVYSERSAHTNGRHYRKRLYFLIIK